jgi:hypothetical protein
VPKVRRKLAFALGLLLGLAFVRVYRGRRRTEQGDADPRAEELRRKLVESREDAAAEPPHDEAADVEEARRRVYEEGRATVEEMRRSAEPPPQ